MFENYFGKLTGSEVVFPYLSKLANNEILTETFSDFFSESSATIHYLQISFIASLSFIAPLSFIASLNFVAPLNFVNPYNYVFQRNKSKFFSIYKYFFKDLGSLLLCSLPP
jgi:hypothetical protein